MNIPSDINGPNSKLIYLYVKSQKYPPSADQMSNDLNLSKLTIFPVVSQLCESGHLEKCEEGIKLQS